MNLNNIDSDIHENHEKNAPQKYLKNILQKVCKLLQLFHPPWRVRELFAIIATLAIIKYISLHSITFHSITEKTIPFSVPSSFFEKHVILIIILILGALTVPSSFFEKHFHNYSSFSSISLHFISFHFIYLQDTVTTTKNIFQIFYKKFANFFPHAIQTTWSKEEIFIQKTWCSWWFFSIH